MSQSIRQRRKSQGTSNIGIWIIGVSAAVVIIVVAAIALSNRQSVAGIAQPEVPAEWIERNTLGDPNAPVVIEAWEDFMCPACLQWTNTVKPRLQEEYIETGQVRLVFRNFPLQGFMPASRMAAMASQCAADQDAFWPYHDRLFIAQSRGQGGFLLENLVEYAGEIGLNSDEMLQCMSTQEYGDHVTDSINQAVSLGLQATPSILIDGQLMANPFDYDAMSAQIDSLVEAAP
ncbi:MAG: DsbA family protein [Litorilinea sp.]